MSEITRCATCWTDPGDGTGHICVPVDGQCRIEHTRPGGRERGDRIVRCTLPRGHEGDHEETDTGSTWHARPPAQIAQDGPAGSGEGAGAAEGSESLTAGSLTDLIGLAPDLTGGLDPVEWLQRQNCDHGPELDELRRQVQAVLQACDTADASEIADRCSLETACVPTHVIRQALGGEA